MINEKDRKDLEALLEDSKDIEDTGDFEELDDGKYLAFIEDVEITTSKAGNLMCKWEFIIDEGEKYAGRHHWKYSVLNSAKNMSRLTTELNKFEGMDTSSLDAIEKSVPKLTNVPVVITISRNTGKNGTVYVNTSVKPDYA